MGANESEFEKIVNKLNIDDKPSTQHKDKLRWRMLAEFNAHGEDEKTASDGFHNKWRTIMNSKIAKLTVAAAIIIAALIGFSMLTGEDKEREEEIVKKQKVIQEINPDQIDGRDDKVVADADRLKAEKLAAQMDLVEKLYAAGNTKGLVAMLKVGRRQSKIAAANYLAKLGDDSALAPLQQLSEQWKGDPEENPFAVAAEKISRQLEQDKEELGQPGQKDVQIVQQNQDNIQVTPTIIVEKPVVAENTVTYSGVIKNEASEFT